jgi:hypothetical protein
MQSLAQLLVYTKPLRSPMLKEYQCFVVQSMFLFEL